MEIVCFIESLAESETPLEMTEVSRGSIRLSMLAITKKPRSKLDFRVDTKSSETPPPLLRQLTVTAAADETEGGGRAKRLWRENGVVEGDEVRCFNDKSVMRERVKARAAAAMYVRSRAIERALSLPLFCSLYLLGTVFVTMCVSAFVDVEGSFAQR